MEIKKLDFSGKSAVAGDEALESAVKGFAHDPPMLAYLSLFRSITKDLERQCVLRGNILLSNILPDKARLTKDLDFDVINREVFQDVVLPRLKTFGDTCIAQGLADDYRVYTIGDAHSGGIKVYLQGHTVYGVDVSAPAKSMFDFEVKNYKFNDIEVRGSTIERIVGDKLTVFLSEKRNRRPKDLYDLYILLSSFPKLSIPNVYTYMCQLSGEAKVLESLYNYPLSEEDLIVFQHTWSKFKARDVNGNPQRVPDLTEVFKFVGPCVMLMRKGK